VTSYDVQGFPTTATIAEGISTGFDDRGFPTTIYPANCPTSNYPMAAGEVLQASTIIRQQSGSQSSGLIFLPTDSGSGIAASARDSSQSQGSRRTAEWFVACGALVFALAFALALA
jgi:hypothetical protein